MNDDAVDAILADKVMVHPDTETVYWDGKYNRKYEMPPIPENFPTPKELSAPTNEQYMVIKLIHNYIVLPHKQGLAVLAALAHAEEAYNCESYNTGSSRIKSMNQDAFSFTMISRREYITRKAAGLLLED